MPSATAAVPVVAFSSNFSAVTKSTGRVILTPFFSALAIRSLTILDPSSSNREVPICRNTGERMFVEKITSVPVLTREKKKKEGNASRGAYVLAGNPPCQTNRNLTTKTLAHSGAQIRTQLLFAFTEQRPQLRHLGFNSFTKVCEFTGQSSPR